MFEPTEEQLADLIMALPPPPRGWVQAATELPLASAALDDIVARCLTEQEARAATLQDLESALRQAGVEPHPALVERLRERLS